MGNHVNIDREKFPQQGPFVGLQARVCFRYDSSNLLTGTIVRDDMESPHVTIIQLEDGRFVLGTECQWTPANVPKKSEEVNPE